MYLDDCGIVNLWPGYFISDCVQAVVFILLLLYVLIQYNAIILTNISIRLKVYALMITLKSLSYVIFFKLVPDLSDKGRVEGSMTMVFVCDQIMLVLFYYMLFKMKIISFIMDYNLRESKRDLQDQVAAANDQVSSRVMSIMNQDLQLQVSVDKLVKRVCKFFLFYLSNTLICIVLRLLLLDEIEDNDDFNTLLPFFIVFQSINTLIEISLSIYFYKTSVHFFIVLQLPSLTTARLFFGLVAVIKLMASIDHLVFMFVKLNESIWDNKYCKQVSHFSATTYWFYDVNPIVTGVLILVIVRFFA